MTHSICTVLSWCNWLVICYAFSIGSEVTGACTPTTPEKDLKTNCAKGTVRQSASTDLVRRLCIPFLGGRPSDIAAVRHVNLPLLHISMPIFVLLFSPELLV